MFILQLYPPPPPPPPPPTTAHALLLYLVAHYLYFLGNLQVGRFCIFPAIVLPPIPPLIILLGPEGIRVQRGRILHSGLYLLPGGPVAEAAVVRGGRQLAEGAVRPGGRVLILASGFSLATIPYTLDACCKAIMGVRVPPDQYLHTRGGEGGELGRWVARLMLFPIWQMLVMGAVECHTLDSR